MASGWWEKKSAIRQPSWMWDLGLGFKECTMSGNCMPSRMKNTCSKGGGKEKRRKRKKGTRAGL
jgi:hypothetical protein